jgi:hypothetical protein
MRQLHHHPVRRNKEHEERTPSPGSSGVLPPLPAQRAA